jgi:hypothetical protein
MTDTPPPDVRSLPRRLLRFGVRALRVTASTVAVVALLRQQWIAAAAFSLAWLLILAAPRVLPALRDEGEDPAGAASRDGG